jgi:hypothetical protein
MSRRQNVSIEDLGTAILWLRSNEGDDDESGPCTRVADWLEAELAKRDERSAISTAAREHGVKPADLRRALKAKATRTT